MTSDIARVRLLDFVIFLCCNCCILFYALFVVWPFVHMTTEIWGPENADFRNQIPECILLKTPPLPLILPHLTHGCYIL